MCIKEGNISVKSNLEKKIRGECYSTGHRDWSREAPHKSVTNGSPQRENLNSTFEKAFVQNPSRQTCENGKSAEHCPIVFVNDGVLRVLFREQHGPQRRRVAKAVSSWNALGSPVTSPLRTTGLFARILAHIRYASSTRPSREPWQGIVRTEKEYRQD